jgi:hypothetical protein
MLVALFGAAIVVTGLCWLLLPPGSRDRRPSVLVAAALSAYVAMRVGAESGVSEFLDHEVLEPFGAEIDDAQTWLNGGTGALLVLWLAAWRRRTVPPIESPDGRPAEQV